MLKWMSQAQLEQFWVASEGEAASVDPETWTAEVMLQPSGIETAWLPISTPYAGPGYGIAGLPPEGAQVTVLFLNGDPTVGKIVGFTFNKVDTPPAGLQPGDLLISMAGGASVKLSGAQITLGAGTQPVARQGDAVQVDVGGTLYTGSITGGNPDVLA